MRVLYIQYRAQNINRAVKKNVDRSLSAWELMTPVLQLRNPRTQPQLFLGFFFSPLRRISAEWMYCYTKLATVWEYQNKLADTPNFERKVERRAQIFVARSRYCEVLSFRAYHSDASADEAVVLRINRNEL